MTSDILKAAKVILMTRGWSQGWLLHPETGEVCVRGAINFAARGYGLRDYPHTDERWCPAVQLLARVATGCADGYSLAGWNNRSACTLEDVLAAFDAAIDIARQQEPSVREEVPCAG